MLLALPSLLLIIELWFYMNIFFVVKKKLYSYSLLPFLQDFLFDVDSDLPVIKQCLVVSVPCSLLCYIPYNEAINFRGVWLGGFVKLTFTDTFLELFRENF